MIENETEKDLGSKEGTETPLFLSFIWISWRNNLPFFLLSLQYREKRQEQCFRSSFLRQKISLSSRTEDREWRECGIN